VYQLFSKGTANSSNNQKFSTNLSLSSAYRLYDESGEEPYTTFKKREEEIFHTIDYIWHSKQLSPLKLLEIPPLERLRDRLPCAEYPSDHLQIVAEFQLK